MTKRQKRKEIRTSGSDKYLISFSNLDVGISIKFVSFEGCPSRIFPSFIYLIDLRSFGAAMINLITKSRATYGKILRKWLIEAV